MTRKRKKSSLKLVMRELMESHGLSVAKLSRKIGLPQATLRYILQGNTDNPRIETVMKLADFFKVSVDYFLGQENGGGEAVSAPVQAVVPANKVPVLDWKSIRYWCESENAALPVEHGEWLPIDDGLSARSFALRINYEGRNIFPKGSYILIDPKRPYDVDDYVIATLSKNKPTIKRIWKEGDVIYLNAVGGNIPSEKLTSPKQIMGTIVEKREFVVEV